MTVTTDLTAAIAAHWSYEPTKNYDGWLCECGVLIMRGNEGDTDKAMHAHLADVLAPVIRAERAAALEQAAAEVGPALQSEVGGHTSTYSVRKWLIASAEAERRGEPNG